MTESESVALPFGDSPLFCFQLFAPSTIAIIYEYNIFVNCFFEKIFKFLKKLQFFSDHRI